MVARRMLVGLVVGVMVGGFGGGAVVMGAKQDKAAEKVEAQVGGMMPGERLEGALGELGLSEEQKGKVEAIVKPFKEEAAKWREDHKAELEKVRADMAAAREAKDREKGKAAMQELRKLMESAPKPRDVVEKLKDVLTPEQMEKLKAAVAENGRKGKRAK